MKKTKLISTISSLTLATTATGLLATSCSCNNSEPTEDKTSVDVTSNPGTKVTLGTIVSNKTQVTLGSFRLVDKKGNVITIDKSSELTLSFTAPNDTGFIDSDISVTFNRNDSNYNVSLVDGVAASTTCHGSVQIVWNNQGTKIECPTKLNLNIVNDSRKDLTKSIYGFDCTTTYTESDKIPSVVGSGVYLELKNPDNGERMDAKWSLIGGDFNAQLLNTSSETPINALKVTNISDQAEIVVVVRAIPLQTAIYKDAYFTLTLTKASATDTIITAAEGSSNYVLQHQSVQVVPNDTIDFTLSNTATATWSVNNASGGTTQEPAKTTDVTFNNNQLTIIKTHTEVANYTIQANYDNGQSTFVLSLIAGAKIISTFKDASAAEPQPIELQKNTQLDVDLAVNDEFTFTINDYQGEVDHWTAVYDRRSPYSIPGFASPIEGDKKTVKWTVTSEDINDIPASSYIYFRAFKANDSTPVATFVFQTKVHVLSDWQFGGEKLPWAGQDGWYHYHSYLEYTESNITAKIDNAGNSINPYTTVADSPTDEYNWKVEGGKLKIQLLRGERSTISIPIQAKYKMSNDIYVVEYSTITVFNVWDYYVTKDGTPSTGNLTISLADYQDAECDKDFAIMKNDVVCTDNTLKWTKTFTTSPTFTGDAANVENYSIVADPVTGEWKVKFNKPKEGGTTPTTGTGTLKFQLTYPETEAITPCTGYTLPSFTVAVTVQ